jgi:hypothetical protein
MTDFFSSTTIHPDPPNLHFLSPFTQSIKTFLFKQLLREEKVDLFWVSEVNGHSAGSLEDSQLGLSFF